MVFQSNIVCLSAAVRPTRGENWRWATGKLYSLCLQEHMITTEQIKLLYDQYLELITREVEVFGVKPTEVRHLIGRLGEFYCALKVDGSLAHRANQEGFDVLCKNGRKISVKTTAQKTGFVAISKKTIHKVDDLMIVQYADGKLTTIYYGCVKKAAEASRFYDYAGNYELDIAKAKKLAVAESTPKA